MTGLEGVLSFCISKNFEPSKPLMSTTQTSTDTTAVSAQASVYDQLGGAAGVQQLVTTFYDEMERSPAAVELRRLHSADLSSMRQTLFEFLSGWLGGPRTYWERTNAKCMMSAHAGMPIHQRTADQWLACMRYALRQLEISNETRAFIDNAFTRVCTAMVNRPDRTFLQHETATD